MSQWNQLSGCDKFDKFLPFLLLCTFVDISQETWRQTIKKELKDRSKTWGKLDWLVTDWQQTKNQWHSLAETLCAYKNTKGTDQLKRTWKISEKILTSIDVHWILCTQQNLNNYTLQSSLSWGELSPWVGSLSKNKQKWIKKLPNIYGIITHFYEWKSVITHSGWDERIKCYNLYFCFFSLYLHLTMFWYWIRRNYLLITFKSERVIFL